jgi:hypothetical protein
MARPCEGIEGENSLLARILGGKGRKEKKREGTWSEVKKMRWSSHI